MAGLHESVRSSRRDFEGGELKKGGLPKDPNVLFQKWMQEAILGQVEEPNAMTVSTVDQDGMPQSRVVYLRDLVEEGFIFYTNYESDKATQIEAHPKVALNFLWAHIDRQVRVCGTAERIPEELSDQYFANRPRQSQIGAWASDQSREIEDRQYLLDRVAHFEAAFKDKEVPRPPQWGGYIVHPTSIEFWTGRSARLHDRIVYSKDDGWSVKRLAP